MLEADFKMPVVVLIGAIFISVVVSFLSLTILSYVIYSATFYLIVYYTLGYLKGKKALVIDKDKIYVRTPFKNRTYLLNDLKDIDLVESGLLIKAYVISLDKEVTLCSNVYSVSLQEVYKILEKIKENS